LPNAARWRHGVAIRACAGLMTSGLLLLMVAITSINEFRRWFKGEAEFALIDPRLQADFVAGGKGNQQI